MILVDAATDVALHRRAKTRIEPALSGILAFLRLTTRRDLLLPLGTGGNLISDAHLAALAIEHGAELCSSDADFSRFPQLRWRNPLAE